MTEVSTGVAMAEELMLVDKQEAAKGSEVEVATGMGVVVTVLVRREMVEAGTAEVEVRAEAA